MWKQEYLTGISFIDEQHKHLHALSSQIRELGQSDENEEVYKLLDDFFYYIMMHFEYENKIMLSKEYPMYYDHQMSHASLLSEVLEGMELAVSNFDAGIEKVTKSFDNIYEKHLKEFDQALSEFERQTVPQKVEDYYFVANGQLIFFENGYIISAFGEVDEKLINHFIKELDPLIKAHYAHKDNWVVITDFRRWNYITNGAVELIKSFVSDSDHNTNISRYYLIGEDGLSQYLVNQMLGEEMKDEIVVHEMFEVLKALDLKNHSLGKTLKTCNFGNLKNVDLKKYFR